MIWDNHIIKFNLIHDFNNISIDSYFTTQKKTNSFFMTNLKMLRNSLWYLRLIIIFNIFHFLRKICVTNQPNMKNMFITTRSWNDQTKRELVFVLSVEFKRNAMSMYKTILRGKTKKTENELQVSHITRFLISRVELARSSVGR